MAYELRADESVAHGLRRVARKELKSAHQELQGDGATADEAIHQVRKRIKKVRAVLTLIEADDGRGVGKSRKKLRKIARALSPLRDADAMLQLLATLQRGPRKTFDEHTAARLRVMFSADKRAIETAAARDRVQQRVDRAIEELLADAKRWRPRHRRVGALAPGVRAAFRRGRKAKECAVTRGRAVDFHEWRKGVKALWYQLRLIEPFAPSVRERVQLLHQASSWLGDDHNADLFCRRVAEHGSTRDAKAVRRATGRVQADLRRKAIARTNAFFKPKPDTFVGDVMSALEKQKGKRVRVKKG